MKALQMHAWQHKPELRDVADPDPGPGEVLVRVAGARACHSDLHVMNELEPGMLPYELPFTLGHETAGYIEALGDGVEEGYGIEVGAPVAIYGPWGCGRCSNCRTAGELLPARCGDRRRRRRAGTRRRHGRTDAGPVAAFARAAGRPRSGAGSATD